MNLLNHIEETIIIGIVVARVIDACRSDVIRNHTQIMLGVIQYM